MESTQVIHHTHTQNVFVNRINKTIHEEEFTHSFFYFIFFVHVSPNMVFETPSVEWPESVVSINTRGDGTQYKFSKNKKLAFTNCDGQ